MGATEIREQYDKYINAVANLDRMQDDHDKGKHKGISPAKYDELMNEALQYSRDLEDGYLWLEKNAPQVAKTLLTNL